MFNINYQNQTNPLSCPKCLGDKFWNIKDGRYKCKNCKYLFTPKYNYFKIPKQTLEKVVFEFLLEHSNKIIVENTGISKYKILKILTILRKLIAEEMKTSEIKSNTSLPKRRQVIGIFIEEDKNKNQRFFAKIIPIDTKELKHILKTDNIVLPYNALIYKNRIYKLTKIHQISSLETFWAYLKKKLLTKGGIRKEKFNLYLAEYSWRYNHRMLSLKERAEILLNLLRQKNFIYNK